MGNQKTGKMITKRLLHSAFITGAAVLLMASGAGATTIITYTTNLSTTEFVGGINSDTLHSTGGQAATIVFTPNGSSGSGVPSNIDLGDFQLTCTSCTSAQTTTFSAFTFDLVIDDTTNNATGEFIGTSSGGDISSDSSAVQVNWTSPSPLYLGPGANNALTGNWGTTVYDIVSPITLIVAPNSGSPLGDTTVQGQVSSSLVSPEPATFVLIGGGMFGLGLIRRRKSPRP
jgi:hypothetical protein